MEISITEQQYLNAINLIKDYREQINREVSSITEDKIKYNDIIVFTKVPKGVKVPLNTEFRVTTKYADFKLCFKGEHYKYQKEIHFWKDKGYKIKVIRNIED